ncbi:hypothetical protein [Kitasatospora purpeofusca]|uniref:hypothetical protein n=1 Tax=Kitasatospora purpeofusca TaxID=67352 RepID=UPI000AA7B8F4|nr:hypothetical protein [Kitasatospora purpeofusca]
MNPEHFALLDEARRSRPDGTKYHRREDIGFGESLHIPEPFGFDLVTGDLLPY